MTENVNNYSLPEKIIIVVGVSRHTVPASWVSINRVLLDEGHYIVAWEQGQSMHTEGSLLRGICISYTLHTANSTPSSGTICCAGRVPLPKQDCSSCAREYVACLHSFGVFLPLMPAIETQLPQLYVRMYGGKE